MRRRHRPGTLFVTGSTGFVGRHVVRAAGDAGWQIIAPPSRSLDITSADQVLDEMRAWTPDAVIHLAYRKGDDRSIVAGSANVARAAAAVGARLVHVSTDVVFGGRPVPYTEADVPDPVIEYGVAKLRAEHEAARAHPGALVVRTSLVYSTRYPGAVERDVEAAVAGRTSTAFFTDEIRCPIAGDDLADGLVALAARTEAGLLHLAGPTPMSRADLARVVAMSLHLDPARVPVSTIAASGQMRPGTVVLDSTLAASFGLTPRSPHDVLRPPT
ncbi:MAG: sugar nucleotide-binding protein [Ilumatobacteraceae bacterium]